ncbi:MAG: cytochrome c3 family protein [Acidobacteriota bacterium]
MKKLFFILLSLSVAAGLFAVITGSAHDFQGLAWNDDGVASATEEICKACHIPHNAQLLSDAPLWNHDLSVAAYTVYAGYDMQSTPADPPTGISALCLSCHDGTVALNAFGNNTYAGADVFATGAALVGTDLQNDHPVSIDMAVAEAGDAEIHDPVVDTTPLGGTISADLLGGGTLVECSACHDVHATGASATNGNLLRISNAASALCLTCHDK